MNKEEFQKEEEYLEKVKDVIGKNREKCIETLKRIPEEYKGRYADVAWGDEDLVADLTKMYTKKLNQLNNLENKPYFGSFDFQASDDVNKRFYLGKTDVSEESSQLVLDWRNPVCTLYYDQSLGQVQYQAPMGTINGYLNGKRQILIENGTLQNIYDVDIVSDDELLKPYLSVNADNKMKTIIASIQAEQNAIIRESVHNNIIVQGVAGSGKTSVALHRIAYLLYNLGDSYKAEDFCIIGPNKFFLNYISSVLPDLDTENASEFVFEEIAKKIINDSKYKCENSNQEINRHMQSENKLSEAQKIKGTIEYQNAISNFLNDYFSSLVNKGIYYDDVEIINADEMKEGLRFKPDYQKWVNSFITDKIKKIKQNDSDTYYVASRHLLQEIPKYPKGSEERETINNKLEALREVVNRGCNKELRAYQKTLQKKPVELYRIFLENIQNYLPIEYANDLREESLKLLNKKTIPYEDLAGVTYIGMMLNGNDDFAKYKHVVIDEAQDYNIFQFNIIKSLFSKSTFSIYGDLAQSIYAYRSIDNWENVLNTIFNNNCKMIYMNKSYRTTKEITELSNCILNNLGYNESEPVIRTGEDISTLECSLKDKKNIYPEYINTFFQKGYQSIGIICKNEKEMNDIAKLFNSQNIPYNLIKTTDEEYKAGINILTNSLAKGLEFDAVIINDASENKYRTDSKFDMHLLYVAATRALHELCLFHEDSLNKALQNYKDLHQGQSRILKKHD